MIERWADVPGYEGLYKVSTTGKIKRCPKIYFCGSNKGTKRVLQEEIIKGDTTHGHKRVALYKDGNFERFMVHRLVAQVFIPNPENKPEIDHINTIRDDNRVENLRWVTHLENINNPLTKQKQKSAQLGEKNYWHKRYGALHHASKKVLCVETGIVYAGIAEAQRAIGGKFNISECCNGKRKTCKGYHWKFV